MAENSKIAWTDNTYNPWIGCSRVSPGCENCYAEFLMDHRYGRVKWGPGQPRSRTKTAGDVRRWNRLAPLRGTSLTFGEAIKVYPNMPPCESHVWDNRTTEENNAWLLYHGIDPFSPPKVFCASLADYLDEEIPADWREDLFDLIDECKNLIWLMLTKRIENYSALVPHHWLESPFPHVWPGVTAENQKYWDLRVPQLEKIPIGPGAHRWVSYEPALGPVNLARKHDVSWIIIGGESSQESPARPFDPGWAYLAIEQCRFYGITPFVKQLGSNIVINGVKQEIFKSKDASDPQEWAEPLQVREFPNVSNRQHATSA